MSYFPFGVKRPPTEGELYFKHFREGDVPPPGEDRLLQEDGFFLLQEDGSKILL